uniref:Ig-like domain-containing protein n=1 Tax=Erpetoichthys calabaricus TaxID=27687 RepID=A0A8C4RFZ3_ERPCA
MAYLICFVTTCHNRKLPNNVCLLHSFKQGGCTFRFLLGISIENVFFFYVKAEIILGQSDSQQAKPGESLQLKCAVEGTDLSSSYMHWIRQAPGKGLEWLIYFYSSGVSNSYASSIKGRFTASKDTSNFYIHMTDLRVDDTAVYYCARRHSERDELESRTKTQREIPT